MRISFGSIYKINSMIYSDFEKKIYGKSKLRTKMRGVRNFLIALLGLFFMIVAFTIVIDVNNAIGDGMKNVRYGLFSLGLIVSGTSHYSRPYCLKAKNKPWYHPSPVYKVLSKFTGGHVQNEWAHRPV